MEETQDQAPTEELAKGQKLVIYAILLYFALVLLQNVIPFAALFLVVCLVMSIIGVFKMCNGLEYGVGLNVLFVVLMFIPLVNIISLLVLNSKATKRLKDAGYEVGFLGVKG